MIVAIQIAILQHTLVFQKYLKSTNFLRDDIVINIAIIILIILILMNIDLAMVMYHSVIYTFILLAKSDPTAVL